ncbi:hypothetical protein H0I39_01480 [Ottowia beijingensis]|uniref:Uncharacterized protein n=1 Tax=Ottowia beijingensis TaxID=1207057 RepID=A0A853IT13_9BURK|nr:hypothetical protein [Ottowia beijingensis]NZA00781.1 hypothetical protein [Ottowia beijingensis]
MTSLRFDDKAAGVWLKARWKAGPRGGTCQILLIVKTGSSACLPGASSFSIDI